MRKCKPMVTSVFTFLAMQFLQTQFGVQIPKVKEQLLTNYKFKKMEMVVFMTPKMPKYGACNKLQLLWLKDQIATYKYRMMVTQYCLTILVKYGLVIQQEIDQNYIINSIFYEFVLYLYFYYEIQNSFLKFSYLF